MTTTLAIINRLPFQGKVTPTRPAGKKPTQRWIKIANLRIDRTYQRQILKESSRNVVYIAENFDWCMFAPVIVAPLKGGLFAIIDGQHRTTAAALCDIPEVPCHVVEADYAKQATAFAAINSRITHISSMQIFAASLAAGDKPAHELVKACGEAGVTILRYPVPHNVIKPGETMAVTCLQRAFARYDRELFITALSCITKTNKTGNPGLVRIPVIHAFMTILDSEPGWLKSQKALFKAVNQIDLLKEFNKASGEARAKRQSVTESLIDRLVAILEKDLEKAAA